MRTSGHWLRQQISWCLLVLLLAPFVAAAPVPQQGTSSSQATENISTAQLPSQSDDKKVNIEVSRRESLPDSPGSVRLQVLAENRAAQQESQQSRSQPQQSNPQPPPAQQQQNPAQEPVGTAAAGSVKATGVAASQPAGAAIAPAKQRRTRSILIKVGALVGAGIAVGTVVALSSASPSRPR